MTSPAPTANHADAGDPVARNRTAPPWKLWANPIFRRYCRSRLRPRGLGIWLLITQIIACFIFFLSRSIAMNRADQSIMDAERVTLIPLLVLQGIILFLLGTGQVASGMTAETDEGVLDYQRLAPISPLTKVLGYLFGLPVREYVLVFATMPLTTWAVWRGGVPLVIAAQLYGVFFTSAILYHVTGLVAGTVMKNRRWAFLISMSIIFLLYTVVPQIAKFGMVYFKYVTLWPVYDECLSFLIPRDVGAVVQVSQALFPTARFFNLDLPESVFTAASQCVFIFTGIVMMWRRWRRTESHLLGKPLAVGFFAAIQVFMLGNALPLIESGAIFPSLQFSRMIPSRMGENWRPEGGEAVTMSGVFGFFTLVMIWILTLMITPSAEGQLRGWRRARKLGRASLIPASDPATAFGWVALMAVAGAAGWYLFSKSVIESHWYPSHELPLRSFAAFALVMLTGGLGFHAFLEGRGARAVGLATIFLGVVPIMAGSIIATVNDRLAAPASWLVAISPASAPVYAAATELSVADLPRELARALPRAFWFWQSVAVLITTWLIAGLYRSRKAIAEKTAN